MDFSVITGTSTIFVGTFSPGTDLADDAACVAIDGTNDPHCGTENSGPSNSGITPAGNTVCCCAQTIDVCAVCGGDSCSCDIGLASGACPTPLQCTPQQEAQSCCTGANANDARCNNTNPAGPDAIKSTNNEKCHLNTCVGCVVGANMIDAGSTACGPGNIAFLVDNDAGQTLICGNTTRISANTVLITSWLVVGATATVPNNQTINEAFLNQFVGVFQFFVYDDRYIELKCLPTSDHHCSVSNIRFGSFGHTFCFAEFAVGDKRKRDASPLDDTRVIGGNLLNPNPFTNAAVLF